MLMQWRAGLRVSEAIALTRGDLYHGPNGGPMPTLRVRRGKGNKSRIVPVLPVLRTALAVHKDYARTKDSLLIEAHRKHGLGPGSRKRRARP